MGLMGEQHGTRLMSQLRSGVVLSLLLLICLTKYVCDAKQDQFLAYECLFSFFALSTSKTYNIRIYRHAYGPLNPDLISCVLVSDCDALILRSVIIC